MSIMRISTRSCNTCVRTRVMLRKFMFMFMFCTWEVRSEKCGSFGFPDKQLAWHNFARDGLVMYRTDTTNVVSRPDMFKTQCRIFAYDVVVRKHRFCTSPYFMISFFRTQANIGRQELLNTRYTQEHVLVLIVRLHSSTRNMWERHNVESGIGEWHSSTWWVLTRCSNYAN